MSDTSSTIESRNKLHNVRNITPMLETVPEVSLVNEDSHDQSLIGNVLNKCCSSCTSKELRVASFIFGSFMYIAVFAIGLAMLILGSQEANLWIKNRNFTTQDGIKIDNFCGNFQYYLGCNAFAGNLVPTICAWIIMALVSGVAILTRGKENYVASISLVMYTILFCWVSVVKAVSAVNFATSNSSCINFWKAQGLQDVLDFMDKETQLVIVTSVIAMPVFPLFCFYCCKLLIGRND